MNEWDWEVLAEYYARVYAMIKAAHRDEPVNQDVCMGAALQLFLEGREQEV